MNPHFVGGKHIWVFSMEQDYVTNTESFVDSITVDHGHIRITDENFNLHKVKNLSPVLENLFAYRYKFIFDNFPYSFITAWKGFIYDPNLNVYVHTERHNW